MEDLESPSLTSQSQSPISLITLESLTNLSQESQIIQARPISRGRTTMASLAIQDLVNLTILSLENLITEVSQAVQASLIKFQLWPVTHGHPFMLKKKTYLDLA